MVLRGGRRIIAVGEALLRSAFESVTRHDFVGELQCRIRNSVVAYVWSMLETARLPDPELSCDEIPPLPPSIIT
jgi:hypothetical protein